METDLRKVLIKYARAWLILDIVACTPSSLIEKMIYQGRSSGDSYNVLLRLVRLPKLYRLLRIARLFKIFKVFKN